MPEPSNQGQDPLDGTWGLRSVSVGEGRQAEGEKPAHLGANVCFAEVDRTARSQSVKELVFSGHLRTRSPEMMWIM
jgi:hypothetical protein